MIPKLFVKYWIKLDIIAKYKGEMMQNALFENLKDLKKNMALDEKQKIAIKENEIKAQKEEKLKIDFEDFMNKSGIKKLS